MLTLWQASNGPAHIKPMIATIYRFVESQEQVATLSLVHTLSEQALLEELLEISKNPMPSDTDAFDYLLRTPFRYPPLKHGSRFGRSFEPGLFYGSLTLDTALAETAYYRFVFLLGPETPYSYPITSEYSSFAVKIRSDKSIFLDALPFSSHATLLHSPFCYATTQALGSAMREAGVHAFQYCSARDIKGGKNVALFTPNAFQSKKPTQLSHWFCQASVTEVGFLSKDTGQRHLFSQHEFWVENTFPYPPKN